MISTMTKKINAVNLLGVQRVYTFNIMDAETGTSISHEWGGRAAVSYDVLIDLYRTVMEAGTKDFDQMSLIEKAEIAMVVIKKLPEVLTWDVLKDLASKMLNGYTMTENNETYTAGENGFLVGYNDNLEVYNALCYAAFVNYEKYITPFI